MPILDDDSATVAAGSTDTDRVADLIARMTVEEKIAQLYGEPAAGQTRTARFTLHADLTSYTGLAGYRIVDPGEVELRVAASSTDLRHVLQLKLTGPQRRIGTDRVLAPQIQVGPAAPSNATSSSTAPPSTTPSQSGVLTRPAS
jgi:hypothetical protein